MTNLSPGQVLAGAFVGGAEPSHVHFRFIRTAISSSANDRIRAVELAPIVAVTVILADHTKA